MKFTQLTGSKVFRPWALWEEGDVIIGSLIRISEDDYGKPNYEISVMEVDFAQDEASYKNKKGQEVICKTPGINEVFVLNSNGSLDRAMENVEVGDVVKVIYQGVDTLKKGKYAGKEFHKLDVFFAPGENSKDMTEASEADLL
jgi:hypothetical protein